MGLGEASGATSAQLELNKKREAEVGKLRKDIEEVNIQNESVLMNLKKKHQDAIQEMTEQIDQLSKIKSKIDKDKSKVLNETNDARNACDEIMRAKGSSEKSNITLGDFEAQKRKLAAENADLLRVAGEINNNANMVLKVKSSLVAALDEAKKVADEEARQRSLLIGKFKNAEHEVDGLKAQYDEEVGSREDTCRQTNKCEGEAAMWRCKYETDAVAKAEELEMSKMKLQARLTEAESTIDNLNMKLAQIEKAKGKLQAEI